MILSTLIEYRAKDSQRVRVMVLPTAWASDELATLKQNGYSIQRIVNRVLCERKHRNRPSCSRCNDGIVSQEVVQ